MSGSHIPSRFVFAAGGAPSVGEETQKPGSRRSQNKDRTRRALLDAADDLFLTKGYQATTLDEICEKAGISLRTFFRYFESKRDLALYENFRNMARLRDLLSRALSPEQLLDELEALYDFMALEFEQDAKARQRLFRMAAEAELAGRSLTLDLDTETRIASAFVAGGMDAAKPDASLVAVMIVGGVRRAVSRWVETRGKGSLREDIAAVFVAIRKSQMVSARAGRNGQ
ncbi:MAG: TetR family transcriptional regulator [Alphaproteobacteria bacterium]|nr:TetR family transcriptional regulator [Alphaproteobacteria bacterium]